MLYCASKFYDEEHNEIGSLCDFVRKTSDGTRKVQYYLAFDEELFQIVCEKNDPNNSFRITVCESMPVKTADGLVYSKLGVITGTVSNTDNWEHQIRIHRIPTVQLLMAVFSLPLTTHSVSFTK